MSNQSPMDIDVEASSSINLRRKINRLNACVGASDFVELKHAFKGILKSFYYRNIDNEIKDICILLTYKKNSN